MTGPFTYQYPYWIRMGFKTHEAMADFLVEQAKRTRLMIKPWRLKWKQEKANVNNRKSRQ